MKKNKLNLILLIILIPYLTYCSGMKDALEGNKRSEQSDEFLVKKKNPLQMPPNMNELPTPGGDLEINNTQKKDEDDGNTTTSPNLLRFFTLGFFYFLRVVITRFRRN